MHSILPFLKGRWSMLFDDSEESLSAYKRVRDQYLKNELAYHNLEHIYECFEALDMTSEYADDHSLVQAAIWYHDVVYDSKAKDNEERSADFACTELAKLTIDGNPIDTDAVRALILETKHAKIPSSANACLLVDIDLRILGSDFIRYLRYSYAIRSEYAWVPEVDYKAGRTKVLQSFLDREFIYSTDFFREHYEASARRNLQKEIEILSRK